MRLLARVVRWRDTTDPLIDTLIVPPRIRYEGADEQLAAKTLRRREAAEAIRRRADAVASGAAVYKVLTMAKR